MSNSPVQIVLIDNDRLIRSGWEIVAKRKDIPIHTFSSVEEFIDSETTYSKDISIYIDSNLENGFKGEVESKKLYQLGYANLFLSTGYLDFDPSSYPWLKGVVGKKPPF
jgi:FixJ family two-component response regulator